MQRYAKDPVCLRQSWCWATDTGWSCHDCWVLGYQMTKQARVCNPSVARPTSQVFKSSGALSSSWYVMQGLKPQDMYTSFLQLLTVAQWCHVIDLHWDIVILFYVVIWAVFLLVASFDTELVLCRRFERFSGFIWKSLTMLSYSWPVPSILPPRNLSIPITIGSSCLSCVNVHNCHDDVQLSYLKLCSDLSIFTKRC